MHPLLFQISLGPTRIAFFGHEVWLGPLSVPSFGALLAVGLLLGGVSTSRLAERAGLGREAVAAVLAVAFFVGLLGARLGYVLLHAGALGSLAPALSLRGGGLSGIFGLATGGIAAAIAARRRRLSVPTLFDAGAPGFALALALTRLGCFLEGCDFGKTLSASAPGWLARLGTFPVNSPAWVSQVSSGALAASARASLPVHPSELYECAAGLALAGLAFVLRRRSSRAGESARAVLLGYLVLRVLVDASRPTTADVWCARVAALLVFSLTAPWLSQRVRARHP